MAAIPEDWTAYIGDDIKSICLTNGHGRFPLTCAELTDSIFNLLPVTLRQDQQEIFNGRNAAVCIGEMTDTADAKAEDFFGRGFVAAIGKRKPYSFTTEGIYADTLIEYNGKPVLAPGGELTGTVTMISHTLPEQKHYRLRFLCPDGWQVECEKTLFTPALQSKRQEHACAPFTIRAGEQVDAINSIILEITTPGRPSPILVPIRIMG